MMHLVCADSLQCTTIISIMPLFTQSHANVLPTYSRSQHEELLPHVTLDFSPFTINLCTPGNASAY